MGLVVVAAIPLIPSRPKPVERVAELDIELVRSAECRYRGITASFDELTRAYALTTYADAELLEWTSWPNPNHPDTEALIRARFSVSGVKPDAPAARGTVTTEHRTAVEGNLDVTWSLSTLASVQVQPYSPLAHDALNVFRQTVDRLLDRMVYINDGADLLDAPDGIALTRLTAGTLLLREQDQGPWSFVRLPSDTTAGWVRQDLLRPVASTEQD